MCNILLGLTVGLILGVTGGLAGQLYAQSEQPWNPYAPGSFNSSTNLYNAQLDADTDNYLNSLRSTAPVAVPPMYSVPRGIPCR